VNRFVNLILRLPFLILALGLLMIHLAPLRAPDPPEEPVETVVEVRQEPVTEPVVVEADVKVTRPWTAEEEIMLARLVWAEGRGVTGERWGVSGKARQAAIIWTVLNRVDNGSWGDTIAEVVTYPDQFAYDPESPVEIPLLDLAYDVLIRWETGGEGRVLPPEYLYFGGENDENYFRREYDVLGDNWDWSLPDPYAH
jgi:hypothetical protein